MNINDRIYEFEIQPNETLEMEFKFAPTEVASYDFDLPIFINRTNNSTLDAINTNNDPFTRSQINSATMTPFQSDAGGGVMSSAGLTHQDNKTPHKTTTHKTSRASTAAFLQKTLKRKVTAVGLRHALHLSSSLIHFKIPIKYFENLKDGGFYEAKVCFYFSYI